MELIKGLFPRKIEKKTLSPSLNIKQIDNSNKEYIKYLENNIELSKTPNKLINIYINGNKRINGMTCKKYISKESIKFVYNLNKNNSKTKSTNESNRNSSLMLPYINQSKNPNTNNNNENTNNSRIRLFNYKVED